ncbi:MAG: hypothetical protein PHQ62_04170 [Clostridia bacterium]|nr:hypothetical protein [Clostridia bacterium]
MQVGYKLNENNIPVCLNCGAKVGKDSKPQINFCANCGSPINIKSTIEFEKRMTEEKIKIIYEALEEIESGKDALAVLNTFIEELKE